MSEELKDQTGAVRIDGKAIAAEITEEVKKGVETLQDKHGRAPGLAVILVGSRKDSKTYVRMKRKSCDKVGITSTQIDLPETVTQQELLEHVAKLNSDDAIDGILVQMPLPSHIDERAIVTSCSHEKDVDGLNPVSMGYLVLDGDAAPFIPCTPRGCLELIKRTGVEMEGTHAVVIGRSFLVGKPISLLLQAHNATVTMCHSRTVDLESHVKRADILVVAVGKAKFVPGAWIKPGAVVIDVGINAVDDATRKAGYRLVGDVDYETAKKVAGHITPVPGGVGPLTIAMLMSNTLESAKRRLNNHEALPRTPKILSQSSATSSTPKVDRNEA